MCAAALLLHACSVVPAAAFPPFAEFRVRAEYRFAAGSSNRVAVPRSSHDLTVLEIEADPRAVESFADGQRWLLVPDGCESFIVHCRYRDYATDGGEPRQPAVLFPGAASLRVVP